MTLANLQVATRWDAMHTLSLHRDYVQGFNQCQTQTTMLSTFASYKLFANSSKPSGPFVIASSSKASRYSTPSVFFGWYVPSSLQLIRILAPPFLHFAGGASITDPC